MPIRLDHELLGVLIEAQGGVPTFVDGWIAAHPHESLDRSTVYRWIKGTSLPKSEQAYLRLCGLLDIDPFALALMEGAAAKSAAEEILRIFYAGTPGRSAFLFLQQFIGRRLQWPPQDIARTYFARAWHMREFAHDPRIKSNFYATITLHGSATRTPQVFHFAFRDSAAFMGRWLEYGFVRTYQTSAKLLHINGHTDQMPVAKSTDPMPIETWFGPGPAQFRVASLHPFRLTVDTTDSQRGKVLRFPG